MNNLDESGEYTKILAFDRLGVYFFLCMVFGVVK